MYVSVLKSKIHNAVVTEAQLHYVGSITIDKNLMDACGLVRNERVLVVNNNSGARLETYTIVGAPGSGVICLNGAAARHFAPGDEVIIMSFTQIKQDIAEEHQPSAIFPYDGNKRWKINDDICLEMLQACFEKNKQITIPDIERIALQMGRDFKAIRAMGMKVIDAERQ